MEKIIRFGRFPFLLLLTGFALAGSSFAQSVTQLNRWEGEDIDAKDGGVFVSFQLSESSKDALQSDVSMSVINLISKKSYEFSQAVGESAQPIIWRLPSGKYAIRNIKALGADGKVYNAKFKKKTGRKFIIRKRFLSNLSTLVVTTEPGEILNIQKKRIKSRFNPTDAAIIKNFKGVINGFKAKIEIEFGKEPPPDTNQSETRTNREVGMFFRLNLFKNNAMAPMVAATIASTDSQIRDCYGEALQRVGDFRGDVKFKFALAKQAGPFKKISIGSGSIGDQQFHECMLLALQQLKFSEIKAMLGELVYHFEYES
jgi:hypothetical protein